uniref:Uncharacterized protein n=2 Tax=Schizaphis graminum TaxID=13262 RepID=A0A2S2PGI5_SCHGA
MGIRWAPSSVAFRRHRHHHVADRAHARYSITITIIILSSLLLLSLLQYLYIHNAAAVDDTRLATRTERRRRTHVITYFIVNIIIYTFTSIIILYAIVLLGRGGFRFNSRPRNSSIVSLAITIKPKPQNA